MVTRREAFSLLQKVFSPFRKGLLRLVAQAQVRPKRAPACHLDQLIDNGLRHLGRRADGVPRPGAQVVKKKSIYDYITDDEELQKILGKGHDPA